MYILVISIFIQFIVRWVSFRLPEFFYQYNRSTSDIRLVPVFTTSVLSRSPCPVSVPILLIDDYVGTQTPHQNYLPSVTNPRYFSIIGRKWLTSNSRQNVCCCDFLAIKGRVFSLTSCLFLFLNGLRSVTFSLIQTSFPFLVKN